MTPDVIHYGLCAVGGCGSAGQEFVSVVMASGDELDFVAMCHFHAKEVAEVGRRPVWMSTQSPDRTCGFVCGIPEWDHLTEEHPFVAPDRREAAYVIGPDGHGVATGGNVDHDALRDALEAWLRRKFLGQPDATDTAWPPRHIPRDGVDDE